MFHHYTSFETLRLILTNRTLRFRRADLLDDESEIPFQPRHVSPKRFFISSWSKDGIGEAGMWSRYGAGDHGVRLSLPEVRFPWSRFSIDVSRETGQLNADGRPGRIGVEMIDITMPLTRSDFFGDGYIATPMSTDLQSSFGSRVVYTNDPEAVARQLITVTATGTTFHGDGTRVARIKHRGWADQAEYRFVLSATRGPLMPYAHDPQAYEQALLDLIAQELVSGFNDSNPRCEHIDLRLAPDAFDGLIVTLGPAMPLSVRQSVTHEIKAIVPSAHVVASPLRIRPR